MCHPGYSGTVIDRADKETKGKQDDGKNFNMEA